MAKDWSVGYGGGSELRYREGDRVLCIGAERGPGAAVVLYVRDLRCWSEPAGEALSRDTLDTIVRRVIDDLAGVFEVCIES